MDKIVIFKNKEGYTQTHYLSGFASFKEICDELIKDCNMIEVLAVKKYKKCPHCNDGDIEVEDRTGFKNITEYLKEKLC